MSGESATSEGFITGVRNSIRRQHLEAEAALLDDLTILLHEEDRARRALQRRARNAKALLRYRIVLFTVPFALVWVSVLFGQWFLDAAEQPSVVSWFVAAVLLLALIWAQRLRKEVTVAIEAAFYSYKWVIQTETPMSTDVLAQGYGRLEAALLAYRPRASTRAFRDAIRRAADRDAHAIGLLVSDFEVEAWHELPDPDTKVKHRRVLAEVLGHLLTGRWPASVSAGNAEEVSRLRAAWSSTRWPSRLASLFAVVAAIGTLVSLLGGLVKLI